MKKTYIAPEALSISLDPKMPLLLGYSRSQGDEGVFTKEYTVSDEDDAPAPTGDVIKNIWDEEW